MAKHPFSSRLRELLGKTDMTQAELADKTGIDAAVISNMMNGKRLSGPGVRERVLKIVEVLVDAKGLENRHDANSLIRLAGIADLSDELDDNQSILTKLVVQEQLVAARKLVAPEKPVPYEEDDGLPYKSTSIDGMVLDLIRNQERRKAIIYIIRNSVREDLAKALYNKTELPLRLSDKYTGIKFHHTERSTTNEDLLLRVYMQLNGGFVILGVPGVGKTFMLRKLILQLLDGAILNYAEKVPILLNLSSWSSKDTHMEDWVAEEMHDKFGISPESAETFLRHNRILLILDGLDEIRDDEARRTCLGVLNDYIMQKHSSVIIGCRVNYYEQIPPGDKLLLPNTIMVDTLSFEEVRAYFELPENKGLYENYSKHKALQELPLTPLMLHVISTVFKVRTDQDILEFDPGESILNRLFAAYISALFSQGKLLKYTREEILGYLQWLAIHLKSDSFQIEQLQPDWIYDSLLRLKYNVLDRVGGGIVAGLIAGCGASLAFGSEYGPISSLENGIQYGLVAAIGIGLIGMTEKPDKSKRKPLYFLRRVFIGSCVFGLISSLLLAAAYLLGIRYAPATILESVLFSATVGGLGAGLIGGPSIKPRYVVVVDLQKPKPLRGLQIALVVGGIVAIVSYIIFGSFISETVGKITFIIYGLVYGLSTGIIFGFSTAEVDLKMMPNKGIRRSLESASIRAFLAGLGSVTGGVLGGQLTGSVSFGLVYGLGSAILVALFAGVAWGGYACLHHFCLRLVLYHANYIPWNYSRLLDDAVRLGLLEGGNGSYRFMHKELQNYLQTMTANDE
jgi:eukaryotic-like serine/threonine-protein kinase